MSLDTTNSRPTRARSRELELPRAGSAAAPAAPRAAGCSAVAGPSAQDDGEGRGQEGLKRRKGLSEVESCMFADPLAELESVDPSWWHPQPHPSTQAAQKQLRPSKPLAKALSCCVCGDLLKEVCARAVPWPVWLWQSHKKELLA